VVWLLAAVAPSKTVNVKCHGGGGESFYIFFTSLHYSFSCFAGNVTNCNCVIVTPLFLYTLCHSSIFRNVFSPVTEVNIIQVNVNDIQINHTSYVIFYSVSVSVSQYIVTYPRVCVTNKTGFGFYNRMYWTFIQLATTVHKSLSDTLSSSSDWTLHGTILTSNWTPLYSSVLLSTPDSARTPRKTPSSVVKSACLLVCYLAMNVLPLLRA
jgi:hypothetical protein